MSIRPANAARRDEASAPWFDGLADGVLLIRRCPRCGLHSRPDAAACPACHADGLEWVPAAGRGTVVCVIVEHREQDEVALGLIELDEGRGSPPGSPIARERPRAPGSSSSW